MDYFPLEGCSACLVIPALRTGKKAVLGPLWCLAPVEEAPLPLLVLAPVVEAPLPLLVLAAVEQAPLPRLVLSQLPPSCYTVRKSMSSRRRQPPPVLSQRLSAGAHAASLRANRSLQTTLRTHPTEAPRGSLDGQTTLLQNLILHPLSHRLSNRQADSRSVSDARQVITNTMRVYTASFFRSHLSLLCTLAAVETFCWLG